MAAVADHYQSIITLNTAVVAISSDTVLTHKIFCDISPSARKVQYPLIADQNNTIAAAFGIMTNQGKSQRATFIIDPEGLIRHATVYPNEVGRDVPELLRILQGLQYTDLTGFLLPAGWQPGQTGIKPALDKAGQY
ncbi:redoxin domain-containing protein [Sporomusa sp.]|uniref:redoxin domain-containing protein n=1 Tax=Sporomusa sp. TaxID=2078658 RepID=UPI002C7DE1A2|nr:redoxin domain-containing protein [Sporomusa sp.]HWR43002.1 redoxin domain-containing protein [Sporomusa sp.]